MKAHELSHIPQYNEWGALFVPAYVVRQIGSGINLRPIQKIARAATFTISLLLPLIWFLGAGCEGESESVTYVNATSQTLSVTVDGRNLTTLGPGDEASFLTLRKLLPNRIRAFSGDRLVHDGTTTWEELEANYFIYVIDGTIKAVTEPSPQTAQP